MKLGPYAVLEAGDGEVDFSMGNDTARGRREIDIGVIVAARTSVTESDLRVAFAFRVVRLATFLQLYFEDIAAERSLVTFFIFDTDRGLFQRRLWIRIVNKAQVGVNDARDAFTRFLDLERREQESKLAVFAAAARRFNSSLKEADGVDRFCDLWECWHFLAMDVSIPGWKIRSGDKMVARISYVLAGILNVQQETLEKKLVEQLFRVRCDIVKKAKDESAIAVNSASDLEQIARVLLRHYIGLPFKSDQMAEVLVRRGIWDPGSLDPT